MKRITKVEDIMAEDRSEMEKDFNFSGKMTDDFVVLPADDPIKGEFGCIVFEKDNDENSLTYMKNVYGSCEKVECDNSEWFFDALQDSLDCNYPTFICDEPKHLRIGFVSLRNNKNNNNGNVHFSLGLSEYKKYMDSKKTGR